MTTIYFAGGEDSDFFNISGNAVSTTASTFRSAYARCSLNGGNGPFWQSGPLFTATTFWTGWRHNTSSQSQNTGQLIMAWVDSSNLVRLRIRGTGNVSLPSTINVEKLDGSGTVTLLGTFSLLSLTPLTGGGNGNPGKWDCFINYNTSGQLTLYQDGLQIFTYSGDVTTNGLTAVNGIRFNGINGTNSFYSELIVADTDTRSWSLQTLAPVANGNTHNFDVGSPQASNVNEITLNDATLDGSTTAGQIDQYTIPAIAGGIYTIVAVGVSARMQKGSTGPSKMDLNVRSGGSDFFSADQVLTTTWANYQNWWTADPNTSATWAALPSNIGLKSVT